MNATQVKLDIENIQGHIKAWKKWEKTNLNSCFIKILVLLKIISTPTFEMSKIKIPFDMEVEQ